MTHWCFGGPLFENPNCRHPGQYQFSFGALFIPTHSKCNHLMEHFTLSHRIISPKHSCWQVSISGISVACGNSKFSKFDWTVEYGFSEEIS